MASNEIDWDLCFICQEEIISERTPTSSDGLKTLAENLTKFKAINALPQELLRIFTTGETNILKTLENNKAEYHHSCRNKYNSASYKRAEMKFIKERCSTSKETPINVLPELRNTDKCST